MINTRAMELKQFQVNDKQANQSTVVQALSAVQFPAAARFSILSCIRVMLICTEIQLFVMLNN